MVYDHKDEEVSKQRRRQAHNRIMTILCKVDEVIHKYPDVVSSKSQMSLSLLRERVYEAADDTLKEEQE